MQFHHVAIVIFAVAQRRFDGAVRRDVLACSAKLRHTAIRLHDRLDMGEDMVNRPIRPDDPAFQRDR